MNVPVISRDIEPKLDWLALCDAFDAGHTLPKAAIGDTFLSRGEDTLLNRAAFVDGMGILVKSATIFPGNVAQNVPTIHGAVTLFANETGAPEALVNYDMVTKWKTAGDSLCAARKLARPDSRKILIVGAGTVGRTLREAYAAAFPEASFTIWNRSPEGAERFAAAFENTTIATDLETAVGEADIITSATMSKTPLIKGAWLRPGQHVDLIGAFKADMREVDDLALTRSRIFVDSRDTTIHHIGELMIPIAAGVITEDAICADYYDPASDFSRGSAEEITLFKNGGGAHLDLMTSRYILNVWKENQ